MLDEAHGRADPESGDMRPAPLDPELLAKAEYFLSYATGRGDRTAATLLAERFQLDRESALALVRAIGPMLREDRE